MDLARALVASGETSDAVREYEEVVALEPNNAEALVALAKLYSRSGGSRRTASLLERAAELRPEDAAWQIRMGRAREEAGDLASAAETYSALLERAPENDVARGLLAELLFLQGKQDVRWTSCARGSSAILRPTFSSPAWRASSSARARSRRRRQNSKTKRTHLTGWTQSFLESGFHRDSKLW